jgi:two-component system response regulator YesN
MREDVVVAAALYRHEHAGTPLSGGTGQPATVTQRVIEYIDRNYANPISLRDVAAEFGYSPCHLTHAFRRTTGTPITAWIIQRRIIAAQRLLGEANVDVATACEAVGFNDLCYFTRQFVRHVGITPGRFRAAMNGAGSRSQK